MFSIVLFTGAAVYKQLYQATPISWCLESKQVTSSALWDRSYGTPHPEYYGVELERLTDRQTGLKTLLFCKLHMWAVIKKLKCKILVVCKKLPSGDFFFSENPKSECSGYCNPTNKKKPQFTQILAASVLSKGNAHLSVSSSDLEILNM